MPDMNAKERAPSSADPSFTAGAGAPKQTRFARLDECATARGQVRPGLPRHGGALGQPRRPAHQEGCGGAEKHPAANGTGATAAQAAALRQAAAPGDVSARHVNAALRGFGPGAAAGPSGPTPLPLGPPLPHHLLGQPMPSVAPPASHALISGNAPTATPPK